MYTVPIIAPDLRHEETIIQAARALDCLRQTINNVFECIDARIATNCVRVQNLSQRVNTAEQRIHNLAGVKNALQLYAPARFPATHVLREPTLTFGINMVDSKTSDTKDNAAAIKYEVQSRVECAAPQTLQEKLVYFHVRSTPVASTLPSGGVAPALITAARQKLNRNSNALGSAPTELRSTVSLLRFNSNTPTYSETASTAPKEQQNWRRVKYNKQKNVQQQILEPAPHSIAHRNQRPNPAGELRYTPKMHEAPAIELPMDLPALEGVAQDIYFMGLMQHVEKVEKPTSQQQSNELAPTTKTLNEISSTTSSVTVIAARSPAPPPPPPPPPPAPAITTPAVEPVPTSLEKDKPLAENESRSALMDAIRKAGGTRGGRLRSAAAAPVDIVDHKHDDYAGSSGATSSGDLMADLHNKLLMRRKGISGVNAEAANKKNNMNKAKTMSMGNPVIQRLSALIPPPPSTQNQQQHQHSDEDATTNNEDEDDWE